MIELLSIFLTIIFFTSIIFFPYFDKVDKVKVKDKYFKTHLKNFDLKTLSILTILNLILFLTLIGLKLSDLNLVVYFAYSIFVFYLLINLKNFIIDKNLKYFSITFASIVFILSIDLAYNLTLFWDAQKLWFPKALIFYNDGSVFDLKETGYSHYSFFGSLLWAFFWKVSNIPNEYIGRISYIVIFCFSLVNFLDLSKSTPEKKIIYFLLLNLLIYNYWHFKGTQEILVFSFLLICSKYLFKVFFHNELNKYNFILVFLSINLIIWTKNEGILLGLIIIFLITIFIKKNPFFKFKIITIFTLLVLIRFSLFKFYGLDINLSKDFDFKNIFEIFYQNLNFTNLFLIFKYISISSFKFPHIILSLICAVLIVRDRKIFKKCYFLYTYLFLSISLIFVIYLSSPNVIEFMVSTGALRLMFEFSSPYLLFIYIFFVETYKKIEN